MGWTSRAQLLLMALSLVPVILSPLLSHLSSRDRHENHPLTHVLNILAPCPFTFSRGKSNSAGTQRLLSLGWRSRSHHMVPTHAILQRALPHSHSSSNTGLSTEPASSSSFGCAVLSSWNALSHNPKHGWPHLAFTPQPNKQSLGTPVHRALALCRMIYTHCPNPALLEVDGLTVFIW